MKNLIKIFIISMLISFLASSALARQKGRAIYDLHKPYIACDTELPLVYSDDFTEFDTDYWSSENGNARIKRNNWLHIKHDTVTSLDYSENNIDYFRVVLRFRTARSHHPGFRIHFTNGALLEFGYNKGENHKRFNEMICRQFSSPTAPEAAEDQLIINFPKNIWHTLAVDYDSSTGLVFIDTNNDCEVDEVLQWEPGFVFSHVSGSNQKWDMFELYAREDQISGNSGLPVFQLAWGDFGDAPRGLAVDTFGNVYVADTSANSVIKFDSNGNLLDEWFDFNAPQGIAIDDITNTIYVANSGAGTVKKLDTQGNVISELPNFRDDYVFLQNVFDVAVDSSGNVYVPTNSWWFGLRIIKFTSDWELTGIIIPYGDMDILGLDVDSAGNLYVTTLAGIQKYDAQGDYLNDMGTVSGVNEPGEFFDGSQDIFIDNQDSQYATDGGENNRIQAFNSDGEFLYEWGTTGSGDGEFNSPARIDVGSHGIFVLDAGNRRVQKFK